MLKFANKLSALTIVILWSVSSLALAEAPSGYYKSAEGKNKQALLSALRSIVGPHTNVGYDGLWEVYETSDVRPGTNYYWDMYSTANFRVGSNKCGNYSKVGDCVNREHSFPKSWFSDRSPMVSDAFHIYPTDGKVNGQRSNYPYGECANGKTLPSSGSAKALGKLGSSTFSGYSGTVFEPDDEYKGDFARTYFYMAACYNDKIASWSSPMLAGNNYPCYTTWAVNLLMKWHKQDPVSEKEINRNYAVYKHQKNRNPFIDHPELADYIWGDKNTQGWVPGGVADPVITSPADGKIIDMGITPTNKALTTTISVKGQALTKDLSVSIAGTGFSVSPSTIGKDAANGNGATITVSYTSATDASATATLKISSSEVSSTVTVKAQAVSGIPALAAENIDMDSFTARWLDIDNDGSQYSLSVFDSNHALLQGYPVSVAASAGRYDVTGLDYSTTYYYSLAGAGKTSNEIEVRTDDPARTIEAVIASGSLNFTSTPNVATEPTMVDIETDYIDEDITVAISGNFEISTDKNDWKKQLTIDKDGERIYVRMPALAEGNYIGTLSAQTPTVDGFEMQVTGVVAALRTFFEDFEKGTAGSSYDMTSYSGNACEWTMSNAGIFNRSGDKFNGNQGVCFGKNDNSSLQMAENKYNGAGSLSFFAAPYGSDEDAEIEVLYSTDNGSNWTSLQTFTITKAAALKEYKAITSISEPVRFRFQQKSGKRVNIDDISITDYSASASSIASDSWDAYAYRGAIVVETSSATPITIYSLDAKPVFESTVSGSETVTLTPGFYIVVNGSESVKVVVR